MNFSDLNFSDHAVIKGATHAHHIFENGWEISVVAGTKNCGLKGDIQNDTFEVAVIRPNGDMLDNVINWQTPVQITTMMHLIEML